MATGDATVQYDVQIAQTKQLHYFSMQSPCTSISTLLTTVKKFFYSSQIELLRHAVEIRLRGLLELTVIDKPRSANVLLQMSKLAEVAGCQVGRVRWVGQLVKLDVLDYGLCNSRLSSCTGHSQGHRV